MSGWAESTDRRVETWGEGVFVFPEPTPTPVREYLESLPAPPHPAPGNPLRRRGLWATETRPDRWETSEEAKDVILGLLSG